MLLNLSKNDLISLVMGKYPSYKHFNHKLVSNGGYYIGGFKDEWHWEKYKLNKYTEKELIELYVLLNGKNVEYYDIDISNILKQSEIINERLHYHFTKFDGSWNIPKDMPFMVEFLNEVKKLCEKIKNNKKIIYHDLA